MKKILSLLLAMTLAFSLAACGGQDASSGGSGVSVEEAGASEAASQPTGTETSAEESAGEGGTLVAYFSWSGNTEHMAQIIAEQTGGSLFEIEPATPYTDDYDTLLDIAQQEQSDNARPELAAQVETLGRQAGWSGDRLSAALTGIPNKEGN